MKRTTLCIMIAILVSTIIPIPVKATESNPTSITSTNPVEASAEAEALIIRLNEIKAMDKSKLTSPQKKQLRTEVRSIRKNLNSLGGEGIYLSVGAIIIIVLLLILLL
jgi:hypothetical protein